MDEMDKYMEEMEFAFFDVASNYFLNNVIPKVKQIYKFMKKHDGDEKYFYKGKYLCTFEITLWIKDEMLFIQNDNEIFKFEIDIDEVYVRYYEENVYKRIFGIAGSSMLKIRNFKQYQKALDFSSIVNVITEEMF